MVQQPARPLRRQPPIAKSRRLCLALAFLLAATVLTALPGRAADSFYLNLLRDGGQALDDEEFERARFDLRVACFGLLEEPVLLSQCWVQIGLAEAALDNKSGFRDSFNRLTEVERLFAGSYAQAHLSPAMRSRYEAAAARWIAESRLIAVPAFKALAIRGAANRLARLPVERRRQELETLISESPGVSRWRLMLGDVYLAERQYEAAKAEADTVLTAEPSNRRALCLRGLAHADAGQCSAAADDLTSCPASRSDRPTAQTILSCQIQLERWAEAKSYFDDLPEVVRSNRKISKFGREIERNLQPPQLAATPADDGMTGESTDVDSTATTNPTAADTAEVVLSAGDQGDLARAREMAAAATYKEDFDEVMQLASRLADGNPRHSDVQLFAGEIAYRARRWGQAIDYLRNGGSALDEDPVLLFYLSVAYFESGQEPLARQFFRRCCSQPGLSPIIEEYRLKIVPN